MIIKSKKNQIFPIESWKTLIKFSVCFLHFVVKVFRSKKDQTIVGEQIKAADKQTTADSSVGRAEDCRKTDILRSLVRVRFGGWQEKVFFETKFNEHIRRLFFEDLEQISLLVWTNVQKEQQEKNKKNSI